LSNFTVSARKYRPGTFDSVVGQQHVTQTLKNAIKKEHIPHALLFCGPRGVGKTTCARILAKALNCENRTADGEPCGECNACRSFATQQAFNIFELDAASNNSVDDIRNLVEQVRFAPSTGKYKIYIIDEVHMLSTNAFNAFLKTLEEPPSYAIFILATTEKHKILPTILSRCQVFDFHRIGIKETIDSLKEICKKESITTEEEALYVIAQKADGALRDALSIFDRIVSFSGDKITYKDVIENLNVLDYDYYFRFTGHFLNKELGASLLLFNELQEKGFDPHNFLNGLSEHLRNLLVCKEPSTLTLLELPEGTQARYKEQSAKAPLSFILSGLSILNQFDVNYKAAKNQRLHIELALMKMCYLQDVLHISPNGSAVKETGKKSLRPQ
jgi:DNA polymerase-3 subunit gamma/tau